MALASTITEERPAQSVGVDFDNAVSVEEPISSIPTAATPRTPRPSPASLFENNQPTQVSLPVVTATSSASFSSNDSTNEQKTSHDVEQHAIMAKLQARHSLCLSWYPIVGCIICNKSAEDNIPFGRQTSSEPLDSSTLRQPLPGTLPSEPIQHIARPTRTNRPRYKPHWCPAYAIEHANVDHVIDVQSTTVWQTRNLSARHSLDTDYVARRSLDIDYVESRAEVARSGKLYQPKIRKGKHGVRKAFWGDRWRRSGDGDEWM